jgi:hypothetical protein
MRGIIVLTAAAILSQPGLAQEKPAPIRVVKTWKDLQEQPPIDLGDGVKIRLGLEADKMPQWSGALLYCLTEGYTPVSKGDGPAPLGPVRASFNFGDAKVLEEQVKWFSGEKNWAKGAYLFVRALPADRVGNYYVTVTDGKGKLIAKSPFEGTKDFFHPWMPWLDGLYHPKMPAKGIALPSIDKYGPEAFIKADKQRMGDLPTLLPKDDKPGLKIKLDGKEILITAETEFTDSRPDYHFLARWWVNDKPFVPKQAETLWDYMGYGRVSEDKELRVEVEFRPERLGAKAGDKIGLQVMHAEGEWTWCAGSSLSKRGGRQRKDGEILRVSNRIEFVAPKTKKKAE